MTRKAAPAFMNESRGLRRVKILQVENRATQKFGEKFAFCDAIAVDVSEPCHRLAHDREQFVVVYVTVVPIEPVFVRAVSSHVIGTLEMERVGHVSRGHEEFPDDDLILAPFQIFKIYYDLHIGRQYI